MACGCYLCDGNITSHLTQIQNGKTKERKINTFKSGHHTAG